MGNNLPRLVALFKVEFKNQFYEESKGKLKIEEQEKEN